ncbi:outer membrane beta-barrel protein [bacterium]|nr:outer membrane beta-barrel protein [bacterium]
MKIAVFVIALITWALPLRGQDLHRNEVFFGLGWAKSYEKSIFNLSPDAKSSPELAINIAYLYHVKEHLAVGLHIYGFSETTPKYNVDGDNVTFDLSAFNLGVQARYIFMRGSIEPYGYLALNLASGSAENKKSGTLNYNGFSYGGGVGLNKKITDKVYASLEALTSLGSANWKQRPFINSTGKKFNPAMTAVVANISYRWGAMK